MSFRHAAIHIELTPLRRRFRHYACQPLPLPAFADADIDAISLMPLAIITSHAS